MTEVGVRLEDRPRPKPKSGEALLRVRRAGICNTDIELSKGYMGFEGILGHEIVGELESLGPETVLPASLEGHRLVPEINCACMACDWCDRGLTNHCPNRSVLGIMNKDGGMAEYLTVPVENLHAVPASVSDDSASFVEPLAAAMHALDDDVLFEGARVAVIGDGKLGLLIAMAVMLRSQSLEKALLVGKHQDKLDIARSFGIDTCLLDELNEPGFDVLIEASGQASGLMTALSLTKPKGKLILKSTYAPNQGVRGLDVDLSAIVINELTVIGSRCGNFQPAIKALEESLVNPEILIADRYPLAEGEAAFERASSKGTLKILLQMLNS